MSYCALKEVTSNSIIGYRITIEGTEYDITRNYILSKHGGGTVVGLMDSDASISTVEINAESRLSLEDLSSEDFKNCIDGDEAMIQKAMSIVTYDIFSARNILVGNDCLTVVIRSLKFSNSEFAVLESSTVFNNISAEINRNIVGKQLFVLDVRLIGKNIILDIKEDDSKYNLALNLKERSIKLFRLYSRDRDTYLAIGSVSDMVCFLNIKTLIPLRNLVKVDISNNEYMYCMLYTSIGYVYMLVRLESASDVAFIRLVFCSDSEEVLLKTYSIRETDFDKFFKHLISNGITIDSQIISVLVVFDYEGMLREYHKGNLKN